MKNCIKKILALALLVFTVAAFVSCGDEGEKTDEPAKKTDWRNTIQYEGAFYVNKSLRVLYAFDTGSITLWDNAGDGEVMQTIKYDTSVPDAIERIEKEDFNGDGNTDIRIIYSETEEGKRYNLFLWSENTSRFAECSRYNEITDPVIDVSAGTVTGVQHLGIFGKITKVFSFNDTSGLDEVSVTIDDPTAIAKAICDATVGGEIKAAEGKATIDKVECAVYVATDGNTDIGYIAHTPDSKWYLDKGCRGFYRAVEEKDGAVTLGSYVGEGGMVESIALTAKQLSAEIQCCTYGYLDGMSANEYMCILENGEAFNLVNAENGFWYILSEDGKYRQISAATGEVIGKESFDFISQE